MTIKALEDRIGSLSKPSKMPCHGYSLPAYACKRGSLLRQIDNSVCSGCYALKNRYLFANVQTALYKRLDAVLSNETEWGELITQLISKKEKSGYFRWHDSGDIQSLDHLSAINNVALSLPDIKFWLPTRETKLLSQWLDNHSLADNLNIRISASMVGQKPSNPTKLKDTTTQSSVGFDGAPVNCPALHQSNSCRDCRACWDKNVLTVNYQLH